MKINVYYIALITWHSSTLFAMGISLPNIENIVQKLTVQLQNEQQANSKLMRLSKQRSDLINKKDAIIAKANKQYKLDSAAKSVKQLVEEIGNKTAGLQKQLLRYFKAGNQLKVARTQAKIKAITENTTNENGQTLSDLQALEKQKQSQINATTKNKVQPLMQQITDIENQIKKMEQSSLQISKAKNSLTTAKKAQLTRLKKDEGQ